MNQLPDFDITNQTTAIMKKRISIGKVQPAAYKAMVGLGWPLKCILPKQINHISYQ
jgi:hypothetical protein